MALDARVNIGHVRDFNGVTAFNAYIQVFNDAPETGVIGFLIKGPRVRNGRIFPPAYGKNWETATHLTKNVAEILYDELTKLLTYDILPIDQAVKPLLASEDNVNKFILG
jgi:hypothetical protein